MTDTVTAERRTGPSIKRAVESVIAREVLGNELKVAYVKTVVVYIACVLDILVYFLPHLTGQTEVSITIPLVSTFASIVYTGFLWALRSPNVMQWLPKLQIAIPLFDSFVLALFITNISIVMGSTHPLVIANVTAFCCLVAISGGIRIQKSATQLTTVLALMNFAHAIYMFQVPLGLGVFAFLVVMGCGLMGMLMSGVVERQTKNETGRLLMEQFLPTNVVETVFEAPTELIAKPQNFQVTIMMADLRGFTKHAEKLEPAELFDFLNDFQGRMSTIVNRNDGLVNTFMGDGMMAVFGAPKISANHADQAVQAAKEILSEVQPHLPLKMGVGLHSGTIVAGYLGTDGHLEFSMIGDTVNVASRLEALTKDVEHSLLISHTTEALVKSHTLQPLSEMPIRGREEQIRTFVVPA